MRIYGGALRFGVTQSSRAEDQVWEAVAEAIAEGWSAKEFKCVAAEAWTYELKQKAKDAEKEFFK